MTVERKDSTISAKVKLKGPVKAADKLREPERTTPRFTVPFTRKNYIAFGVGLALVVLGYICLSQPPAEGFLSLTLAPILLVIGYCVVFPYAILARDKAAGPRVAPKGD